MTESEHELINIKFKSFEKILEVQLLASNQVLCEKIDSLDKKCTETKVLVGNHAEWHDSLNRRIVGNVIKYSLYALGFGLIILFTIGSNNGLVSSALAKVIGL